MNQFDLNFGRKLAETAHALTIEEDRFDIAAKQVTAYLSLLSIEISLKAMLEKAGVPHGVIRGHSHGLSELLSEVCRCEVNSNLSLPHESWVSAVRIRAIRVQLADAESTVGEIVESSEKDASKYPNQIRYGSGLRHFPPEALAQTALRIVEFAVAHWDGLRLRQG